ncbi:MAG: hypothetical protein WCI73_11640 [Phycisphaerae bacterium]
MNVFSYANFPFWVNLVFDGVLIVCCTYMTLLGYGKIGPKRADMHIGKYDNPKALDRGLAFLRWVGPILLGVFGVKLFYDFGVLFWQWPIV